MSIFVDMGAGSKELADYIFPQSLVKRRYGLPTDVVFSGNGPNNRRITLGIEHKRIQDVLTCIVDGRFAGTQLEKLRANCHLYWLMIEGIYRCNSQSGRLEIYTRRPGDKESNWYNTREAMIGSEKVWMYREFFCWRLTMELCAGVKVIENVPNKTVSAMLVTAIYHHLNSKEWDDHRSHIEIDDSQVTMAEKSTCFRCVMGLPDVHMVTAAAVEAVFGSLYNAVNASVGEWAEVKIGRERKQKRRIGMKVARRIFDAIRGVEPNERKRRKP